MKTKVRNGIIAASLACVALSSAALCMTTGKTAAHAEEAIVVPQNTIADCEQVLNVVREDLPSLVVNYNRVFESDWAASEIEYYAPVILIEDKEYGMYLDFDADNGYAVITTSNKIYALEPHGELEYLRDVEDIYFSYIDGFMYVGEDNRLHKYEQEPDVSTLPNDMSQALCPWITDDMSQASGPEITRDANSATTDVNTGKALAFVVIGLCAFIPFSIYRYRKSQSLSKRDSQSSKAE